MKPIENEISVRSFAWESPPDAPDYSMQEVEASLSSLEDQTGRAERSFRAGDLNMHEFVQRMLDAGRVFVSELEGMQ